jgi:hypothetical protein
MDTLGDVLGNALAQKSDTHVYPVSKLQGVEQRKLDAGSTPNVY